MIYVTYTFWTCSAGWWLMLICYKRKVPLADLWIVLIWYEKKITADWLADQPAEQAFCVPAKKMHTEAEFF